MNLGEELMLECMKHRGCGIRAASYEIESRSWLPEACVWLKTESGLRRVWIHSFAHCFDAEKLTFSNKLDADSWALGAAKAIIDRALDKLECATLTTPQEPGKPLLGMWWRARRPMLVFKRVKGFLRS